MNPVLGDPQNVELELQDPFVLKWNGEYFLYTSGAPITAYHSTDFVQWDFIASVFNAADNPEAWNPTDVWAAEVVYRNGEFYLYYTASRKSDDWRVGETARRIGVAVSDNPRGPFVDWGQPVTPGWDIDGTIFKDYDNGAEYFFTLPVRAATAGCGNCCRRLDLLEYSCWQPRAHHSGHRGLGRQRQ